ncbi:MAG: polysaccharide biosynthesis tyrosine autokinase [Paludibacteraceae bacterium]|nr:polysaccharide biosynthesis tyrosine autokinase [Paludibacteraceae bacterium]
MANQPTPPQQNAAQSEVNYREILEFVWRLRYWMVGAAFITLIIAFVYVRTQTPIYERTSWVMLNTNDGSNTDMALLAEFTGRSRGKHIDNELFILRSPSMMAKTVEHLGLNTRYFYYQLPVGDRLNIGRGILARKRVEYYGLTAPLRMDVDFDSVQLGEPIESFAIRFKHQNDGHLRLKKLAVNNKEIDLPNQTDYAYGEPIVLPGLEAFITVVDSLRIGADYSCTWTTPKKTADAFVKNLTATKQGKATEQLDVAILTYQDALPKRAEDILNTIVYMTNLEAKNYKNLATVNTIKFIDQRIDALNVELQGAEDNFRRYQSNNTLVDLASQGNLAVSTDMQYRNQLTEVQLQLRILDMVADEINRHPEGEYEVIPSNIGLSDPALSSLITRFDQLLADRNRLLSNSSANNPRVLSANSELADGKRSILSSIENLRRVYSIRERELSKSLSTSQAQLTSMPTKQFEVQQLSRQINIIEPLYVLLQQKREEAQIAMCGQTDNFRVVEAAFGSPTPVSPHMLRILMMALLLGLCIPPAIVFIRMFMRSKVETKKDITDRIQNANVLAVIPHSKLDTPLIPKHGRDATSESFRMLRSDIHYLNDAKVVQITSSVPGEGKTHTASNLALSLAHMNKKVLIMGFDLRKPALPKFFPSLPVSKENSIVGYLIGLVDNPEKIVLNSGIDENLDIMFSGIVPPNPTELLSQDNVKKLIDWARAHYDYIIMDTTPYLPVSDSFLINAFTDITIYVVRSGVTDLKLLDEINQAIYSIDKPMKRPYFVLNDLDVEDSRYRYGYGAGYGYGYGYGKRGYGYGYGYGFGYGYGDESDNDGKKKKNHQVKKNEA